MHSLISTFTMCTILLRIIIVQDNMELHMSSVRHCMQQIIFHKVHASGPLPRIGSLWFNSCKWPPPVNDHSVFSFWGVTYGRFNCTQFWIVIRARNTLLLFVFLLGSVIYHSGMTYTLTCTCDL